MGSAAPWPPWAALRRNCGGPRRWLLALAAAAALSMATLLSHSPAAAAALPSLLQLDPAAGAELCARAKLRNLVWPVPRDPLLAVDPRADLWLRTQAWAQSLPAAGSGGSIQGPYIDAGCGTGRVLARFGRLFGSEPVYCVEQDAGRIAKARSLMAAEGWVGANVTFINAPFPTSPFPEGMQCQFITLIHVIEYLTRFEIVQHILRMKTLLSPDGVAVVATKFAMQDTYDIQSISPPPRGSGADRRQRWMRRLARLDPLFTPTPAPPARPARGARGFSATSLRSQMTNGSGRGLMEIDAGGYNWRGSPDRLRAASQYIAVTKRSPRGGALPRHRTEPYVPRAERAELQALRDLLAHRGALCSWCRRCDGQPGLAQANGTGL
eukprot:TRINITY_DN14916_c0_g1_i2.p1 TRINITY_DN14916_c0_g1~~TRINITY_DN14916_c0_g1_i2.p1  ORF type:complete len:381 (+),score=89.74 TRINITY_DN14916_c0_g1_i2:92-1234(+)